MFLKFLVSMAKNVKLFLNNDLICSECKFALGFFDRLFGLMFLKKPNCQKVLIFKNAPWIHSFFVFFKFDAIFLDGDFKVIAYKCNIPPFSILKPVFNSTYTLEVVNRCFDFKIGDKILIDEH